MTDQEKRSMRFTLKRIDIAFMLDEINDTEAGKKNRACVLTRQYRCAILRLSFKDKSRRKALLLFFPLVLSLKDNAIGAFSGKDHLGHARGKRNAERRTK